MVAAGAGFAFCQGQPARLEFEVAAVKAAAPLDTKNGTSYSRHIDGAQVWFRRASLRDCLRIAYRVRDYQIEGPAWLASARFDISGKVPDGCTQEQVPEMLQALLEDRFALKLHRASKSLPVYFLTVRGDGLKMKESPAEQAEEGQARKPMEMKAAGGGGRGGIIDYGGGSYFAVPHYRMEGRKLPMDLFADLVGHLTDRPVLNQTELSSRYDFTLDLSEDDYDAIMIRAGMSIGEEQSPKDLLELAAAGDPLSAALRRLGLQLKPGKGPVEILMVDDIRRTPTEN